MIISSYNVTTRMSKNDSRIVVPMGFVSEFDEINTIDELIDRDLTEAFGYIKQLVEQDVEPLYYTSVRDLFYACGNGTYISDRDYIVFRHVSGAYYMVYKFINRKSQ